VLKREGNEGMCPKGSAPEESTLKRVSPLPNRSAKSSDWIPQDVFPGAGVLASS
jgi:hypothetical protein